MCGILGTINKSFEQETLDLISHRGPDDSDKKHHKKIKKRVSTN